MPLGGGMTSSPAPGADGEGVYPHSYERLGVQHGYHSNGGAVRPLAREHHRSAASRCRRPAPASRSTSPLRTRPSTSAPGRPRTAVATCPGNRVLFGGGFQRTDFTARGGDYITESRAISDKSWSVTGHAFGGFGGELTAIAYCWHSQQAAAHGGLRARRASAPAGSRPPRPRPARSGTSSSAASAARLSGSVFFTNGFFTGDRRLVGVGDEPFRAQPQASRRTGTA